MADEQKEQKKGGFPLKTALLILALLLAEGGAVIGVLWLWGGPGEVQGSAVKNAPDQESQNELDELLIVRDKFPNHATGRVWLWDVEVQVQVKKKHLSYVKQTLEDRKAEIKTGVSRIIRNAHQNHLQEPSLETLTRQLTKYLRGVFGEGAGAESRIEKVLLPKCVGFPADF